MVIPNQTFRTYNAECKVSIVIYMSIEQADIAVSHILLVEDNPEMRMMLCDLLQWGGHSVTAERSGEDALAALAGGAQPDMIISDLKMPGMDGLELLQHVRQNQEWAHIPFIMMSGNLSDFQSDHVSDLGIDGLLPKPFDLETLNRVLGG